jgi:hypothetical protein
MARIPTRAPDRFLNQAESLYMLLDRIRGTHSRVGEAA